MFDKKHNPYVKKSEEEKLKEAKAMQAIDRSLQRVADTARELLSDERYVKYKNEYDEAREKIMEILIENKISDPMARLSFQDACLAKLAGLKMIFSSAYKDKLKRAPKV